MAITDDNDFGYEPNLNYEQKSYEILKLILEKLSLIEDRLNKSDNEKITNQELSESSICNNLINRVRNNESIKNIINGLKEKKILDRSFSPEVVASIDKSVISDIIKDISNEEVEEMKKNQPIFLQHSDGTTTILVKDYNDLRTISEKLVTLYIKEVKLI